MKDFGTLNGLFGWTPDFNYTDFQTEDPSVLTLLQ